MSVLNEDLYAEIWEFDGANAGLKIPHWPQHRREEDQKLIAAELKPEERLETVGGMQAVRVYSREEAVKAFRQMLHFVSLDTSAPLSSNQEKRWRWPRRFSRQASSHRCVGELT